MKIKFYGTEGNCKGERDVAIPEFDDVRGIQALKEVLVASRANLRQGNACAKTRGEVRGSGTKPYRQKGTGMARHGEKRSPIWRKGGVVFGPRPRDFSIHINRKVKDLALKRALFDRSVEEGLALFEGFVFDAPKSARMAVLLRKIFADREVLIVDHECPNNALLSIRNLPWAYSAEARWINAWDLVRHRYVVVTERGMEVLLERLQS
jgi:large subunit ribosomal protein L4